MTKDLVEEFNEVVEKSLAGDPIDREALLPEISSLATVAGDLRGLPRQDFRETLRKKLEGGISMPPIEIEPVRKVQTLTPYLTAAAAEDLIAFVRLAFDGEELMRATGSAGGLHCEVRIGDSVLMIGGGVAWRGTPMPTSLHLYVKDADAVYRRALEAGATSTHEPVDQLYGDREAGVRDLAGNDWYIATHKATGLAPEGLGSVTPFLHPRGAANLIDFLERALGAETIERHQSPDGVIQHATVRIGESILEMGEAHGPYRNQPTMFYLSVPDVDASYRQAVAAGAVSHGAPANQGYGARVASVADPAGNLWYLAAPLEKSGG